MIECSVITHLMCKKKTWAPPLHMPKSPVLPVCCSQSRGSRNHQLNIEGVTEDFKIQLACTAMNSGGVI